MCNVNYLIEIRRFNTFAARTRLPASAQLLWYKLIEIMNQHARGGDWCDGFLRIDNPYLLAYFPMSATALADARRTLCESGLLEYIPGEKKRTPPAYRLHYFSVCDGKGAIERDYPREISADSTADCHADCPEIRDYPRDHPNYPSVYPSDCTTVCPTDCTTDCHGNTPDFHDTNINYTETETETVTKRGKRMMMKRRHLLPPPDTRARARARVRVRMRVRRRARARERFRVQCGRARNWRVRCCCISSSRRIS